MSRPPAAHPVPPDRVLHRIVETLEAHGLGATEYCLYETVDVDALNQLLDSAPTTVEVQFTVEEVELAVTAEYVKVVSGTTETR